jgi:hypothetical protein
MEELKELKQTLKRKELDGNALENESEKIERLTTALNYLKRKERTEDIALPKSRLKLLEATKEMLGGNILPIGDPAVQTVRLGLIRDIVCGPIETSNSMVGSELRDSFCGPIELPLKPNKPR